MKEMILTTTALALTVMTATGTPTASASAPDDIYYSKSNTKKAIYAETASDSWSTDRKSVV